MSYPQQVPPGWERGEPVRSIGTGPRYAIGLDLSVLDPRALDPKGCCRSHFGGMTSGPRPPAIRRTWARPVSCYSMATCASRAGSTTAVFA